MPDSVANAAPTTVLPWSLCRAFSHSREFAINVNEYADGSCQVGQLVSTSRKTWKISRRLTPTLLGTLRAFYEACNGPQIPFYFYDPWDSGFTYDPTGVQIFGRYTVRFEGAWDQTVGMARADVDISLVELA